ncbi:MAG TPA: hypothetical protein VLY04_25865 [Bryobacteraceae bacterium]|nr:hypothetical protein [Bryobacteraceae bacterium]
MDDMRGVWQKQSAEDSAVSLEEVRRQARRFRGTIFWRNVREFLVLALLTAWFGLYAWKSPFPVMRAGNALTVAGLLYAAYQLHKRASAAAAPADMARKTCLGFHRAQLERQRDALRGVWRWYLGPMVPGLAVIAVAAGMAGFERSWSAGLVVVLFAIAGAVLYFGLGRLNQGAARQLQRQIDLLDELEKETR